MGTTPPPAQPPKMAGPTPQPTTAAFGSMPKEVLEEYNKLMAQQRDEETQFKQRVDAAKVKLLQKHATETQQFWAKHPRSAIGQHPPGAVPQTVAGPSSAYPQPSRLLSTAHNASQNNAVTTSAMSPQQRVGKLAQNPTGMDIQTAFRIMSTSFPSGRADVHREDTRFSKNTLFTPATANGAVRQPDIISTPGVMEATSVVADRHDHPAACQMATANSARPNIARPPVQIDLTLDDEGSQPRNQTTLASVQNTRANNRPVSLDRVRSNIPAIVNPTSDTSASNSSRIQELNKSLKMATTPNFPAPSVPSLPSFQHPLHTGPHLEPRAEKRTTTSTPGKMPSPATPHRRKKAIPSDPRPEISPKALRDQRNDRSSILTTPPKLPRDPSLLGLQQQQQSGGFVGGILRNDRSQGWAPGLGSAFDLPGRDGANAQVSLAADGQRNTTSVQNGQTSHMSANIHTTQTLVQSSHKGVVTAGTQAQDITPEAMPSIVDPPRGQATSLKCNKITVSAVSGPPREALGPADFAAPPHPVRNVQSNSNSVLPNVVRHEMREADLPPCAPSQTPGQVHFPNGGRSNTKVRGMASSFVARPTTSLTASPTKRPRQVSVSSSDPDLTDSDSEFDPNPPMSPTVMRKKAQVKAKASNANSSPEKSPGKSKKHGVTSKKQKHSATTPSTPHACNSTHQSVHSTPGAQKRSKTLLDTPPASPSTQTTSQRTPRSAMLVAREKINEYVKLSGESTSGDELCVTDDNEVSMQDTNHNKPTPNRLTRNLRALSLSPSVPTNTSEKSIYTAAKWRRDRANGDRYLAKTRATMEDDESESDLTYDVLNAKIVGGRIIMGPEEGTPKSRKAKEITPEYMDLTHL